MNHFTTLARLAFRGGLLLVLTVPLSGCDDPQVYGSIGVSSYHGSGYYGPGYGPGYYGGGPRVGGSVVIGGRIY
ncbi:MAG: hypothetical protein V2I63_08120 [Pseudomonadales bacterium]|jgi:hypothetical protein|nr:hypothetical protein [Pseudomonadales bacterium]